jgi:hypothetical protein
MMAKGKKTGTAPGKKPEPGRTGGFEGPYQSKKRIGGSAIAHAGRAASWASTDVMANRGGRKTTSGIKPTGAGRTPRNKGGSGGNPGKK